MILNLILQDTAPSRISPYGGDIFLGDPQAD